MQPASRTPNSILRKRINKENEDTTGRLFKRNRLANRRVSFAPDDELETKHIFKEDFDRKSDRKSTGDLGPARAAAAPLGVAAPLAVNSQFHGHVAGETHGVMCSPDYLSPLSMDLTNNSFEPPVVAATTEPPGAKPSGEGAGGPGPMIPHQAQNAHHNAAYTRMDITIKVPNLSTLVEEDEEECCAGDASSRLGTEAGATPSMHPAVLDGVSANEYLPSESPFSPNSIREMELCRDEDTRVDQESAPLQDIWGFAPGKDDTLEVNYRHVVMGDKTYNHVYGTATTTGDMTRAIGAGGLPLGQPAAINRLLQTGGPLRDAEAPAGARVPAQAGPETGIHVTGGVPGSAAARGYADGAMPAGLPATTVAPAPDKGLSLAAGADQVRPAGRRDPPQHTELSAVQPEPLQPFNVPPELAPRPLQTRVQVPHSTPFLDNTTRLLEEDHTDAWRIPGAYDRGRLSVASNRVGPPGYRRGAGVSAAGDTTMLLGPTMTLASAGNANPNTVQLLADTTTNHRAAYERYRHDNAGRQESPPAALPPRAATGRRPDGFAPAFSVAAEQRMNACISRNMSLELKTGGCGDLLEDGALSLDAFQLPPEPTMALSQLQGDARQRQGQGAAGEAAHSTAIVAQLGRQGSAQAAAPAAARGPPPRLSYQEFLSLIDLSFIDKICRDTYEHGSDPPPKTVAEVYEAAMLTTAYVETYHTASLDLTARLANMATHMSKMEAELTANRQDLFAAVKMLAHNELETVKDQFARLKELCRLRTVKLIKQTQVAAMETYLAQLGTRKQQLQADMEAITDSVARLDVCAQEADGIPAALTRIRQEDDSRLQEAVQRRRAMEAQLQRLQALRAQNAERQRRLDQAMAEQQAKGQARGSIKPIMDERDELEARAAFLRNRLNTNAMTPGREGQLIRQAAQKSDTVDALLGFHGLRLDITDMEHTGTFKLLFRRTYGMVCTAMDGVMRISVRCHDPAAGALKDLAPSILESLQSSAEALSCSVPRAQLQQRMEHILEQLQRMCRTVEQLESCWLRFQCMQKPYIEPVAEPEGVAQEVRDSGEPSLVLRFINADTTTAVTIRMPWSAVLRCDYVKPQLRVQLTSLDPPETQRQYCDALQETVLSKLEPSMKYLSAVCYAMSETLQVPGGGL